MGKNRTGNPPRGLSLLELIVVLAIIGVLLGIIFVNQAAFNRSIVLTDTAYTIALSIRQTQSLGLSGKGYLGTQNVGYGIDLEYAGGAPITSYLQFADTDPSIPNEPPPTASVCPNHQINNINDPEARPGDCLYAAGKDGLVRTYSLSQGYYISQFCGYVGTRSSAQMYCDSGLNPYIDIVFERPNTQTVMIGHGSLGAVVNYDTTCITLSAPPYAGSVSRVIQISKYGKISVQVTCTP